MTEWDCDDTSTSYNEHLICSLPTIYDYHKINSFDLQQSYTVGLNFAQQ